MTGEVQRNGNDDGLFLVDGEEIHVQAVVLYGMPLVLVSHGGVGLAIQLQVYDVGSGRVSEALELFFVNGEKDVLLHVLTIEIAGNETLFAVGLEGGLVAFLADFAFERKMLHC